MAKFEVKTYETCVSVYKCWYEIEAESEEEANTKFRELYKAGKVKPYDQELLEEIDWDIDEDAGVEIKVFDYNVEEE